MLPLMLCLPLEIPVKLPIPAPHLIYVYDSSAWYNISVASFPGHKRDSNEIMDSALNFGAGPLRDLKQGAFHTDQYQLFSVIYNRILRDPRRTFDPAKATTFVIPYDLGLDAAYYKRCVKSTGRCYDFRRCPLAPQVEELLRASPWFQRRGGRDHLLIVGMNYAMDHYIGKPKCKALLGGVCRNCTKVAIDDYSYMHSADQGIVDKGDYWHAVPFPADFHWTKEVQTPFPWENTNRPVLVSYIGTTKSWYNPARRIRGSIVHYCELHPGVCVHQSYGMNGTRDSFKVEGHNPLDLSAKSVFCFQPIGDLMTRKGLFDSMLQGCIPVVFDVLTAQVMYTWHWEEEYWNEVVVSFLFHPVAFRYFDPVAALIDMYKNNTELVKKKQRLLRERVFELQYSLEGREELNGPLKNKPWFQDYKSDLEEPGKQSSNLSLHVHKNITTPPTTATAASVSPSTIASWPSRSGKPMRDAYEILIDHILGWHSGTEPDFRNATVPECWNGWLDKKNNKCTPGEDPSSKKGGKRK